MRPNTFFAKLDLSRLIIVAGTVVFTCLTPEILFASPLFTDALEAETPKDPGPPVCGDGSNGTSTQMPCKCKSNPPDPGDGGWAQCKTSEAPKCKAHIHMADGVIYNEIGGSTCPLTAPTNVETHIKCENNEGGIVAHGEPHNPHSYCIHAASINCQDVLRRDDCQNSTGDAETGEIPVENTCPEQNRKCCVGNLTGDNDKDPKNPGPWHTFVLCQPNGLMVLKPADQCRICKNLTKCSKAPCKTTVNYIPGRGIPEVCERKYILPNE